MRETALAMTAPSLEAHTGLRKKLHDVIFEADTPAGKAFDVLLILAILASVFTVMIESVQGVRLEYGWLLRPLEWVFTALFTVEYVLRLYSVRRPGAYARSFFGLVDLISVMPTYLSLFLEGAQSLLVIRALRLLRIFRVLKLAHYLGEADVLKRALETSRPKITVFLIAVVNIAAIMGTLMYLIEGEEHGFSNIPLSVYWAIVTMTTVGFGDLAPATPAGQMLATILMLMGYGIIAVPTGIVTAELTRGSIAEQSVDAVVPCLRRRRSRLRRRALQVLRGRAVEAAARMSASSRRGSQAVRQRPAKPLFAGSIPARASTITFSGSPSGSIQ